MTYIEKSKKNIIKKLNGKKWTRVKLCAAAGLPASRVTGIESNDWNPTLRVALLLDAALGASWTQQSVDKIDAFLNQSENTRCKLCTLAGFDRSVLKDYNKQWNPRISTLHRFELAIDKANA
jgi:transcriptional regulator with XRE-family HTH domain